MKYFILLLAMAVGICSTTLAQPKPARVAELEGRVSTLEQKIRSASNAGLVLVLFGAFCALWAQNSGRNAWGWFFFGLFLNVIAVAVLLSKNARDRDQDAARRKKPFDLNDYRQQ